MTTNKKEPIIPEFYKDNRCSVYSYIYGEDSRDKIYYSTGDDELRKDMLNHSSSSKANKDLAGDLKQEFYIEDDSLTERLQEMIRKHLNTFEGRKITKISIVNPESNNPPWINYMKPTEYNPVHKHSGLYSFVWYLDIPEEIRKEWEYTYGTGIERGCIQFSSQVLANHIITFNPQTNDLFLFDAQHPHQVYPFYSDNTRISLAGNIFEVNYE